VTAVNAYWDEARDAAVDRAAEDRADERRNAGGAVEEGPRSDPRSRYGDPADWHFPRGYGGF
jgi:hypothetical protein